MVKRNFLRSWQKNNFGISRTRPPSTVTTTATTAALTTATTSATKDSSSLHNPFEKVFVEGGMRQISGRVSLSA